MKFIKLDLLTLLISLFILASCENTSTIGLEIDPSIAIQGALIDSSTVVSRTIRDDVANTRGAARYPLGYIKDPIFGTTEASMAMTVNLPVAAYSFGTSPVIDSAILILNYGGEFYGDSTATYSFDVHQLSVNLSKETTFPSTKEYPYFPALVGNKTAKLYPATPIKVTDVVVGAADTIRVATPQVRIRLDKNFIQQNIANAPADNLLSNLNFNRAFGGLHVQVNKTGSSGNGGVAFFEFANDKSQLAIFYKKRSTTSTTSQDTVSVAFPISSTSNVIAATVKHNYASTPVEVQLNDPTTQYARTYIQPLAGVRNRISFPYLGRLATNVGRMVVNKAELVIDLSAGFDAIPYGAAPRLALYRNDIAERRQNLPDNNVATQYTAGDSRALAPTVFGGYYNPVTRQYIFVVTAYIQDLLDGKTVDYGTFLSATPTSAFELAPSISTGTRSVIGAFKKNPVAGDNLVKLNIYYTKIN